MNKTEMTHTEFLINEFMKKKMMTHKEVVQLLLKKSNNKSYNNKTRKYFDPFLYGKKVTRYNYESNIDWFSRTNGFFQAFCKRTLINGQIKWRLRSPYSIF